MSESQVPRRVQGAGGSCPGVLYPGDWGSKGLGTGLLPTGLPHPILILLLPPSDVNEQFSWSQEKTDGKALVICRASFRKVRRAYIQSVAPNWAGRVSQK